MFGRAKSLSLLLFALAPALGLAQVKTYIALGDSLAWGYQPNDVNRDPGDKGYVRQVADWIGTQQGGTRPVLINLGVPGETSGSFYDTSEIGAILNSNYPLFNRKSQSETFKAKVAQELGRGHVVTHVTFALGGNDLLEMLSDQFLALPYEQQTAMVDQKLAAADVNIAQELALIRQQLPFATVVVPGYYNPYGAYPGSPADRISKYAIPRLNHILAVRARQFGAGFADTYVAFLGHELAWTWIGEDDVHARDPGYSAMAQRAIWRYRQPIAAPAGTTIGW